MIVLSWLFVLVLHSELHLLAFHFHFNHSTIPITDVAGRRAVWCFINSPSRKKIENKKGFARARKKKKKKNFAKSKLTKLRLELRTFSALTCFPNRKC